MTKLSKLLVSSQRADRSLLTLLGALWGWKILEILGRHAYLPWRNLGWGYFVDLSVPIGFTSALGLFFLLRRISGFRR
jgi:hypothetical protein